jgi:hypothetical protein
MRSSPIGCRRRKQHDEGLSPLQSCAEVLRAGRISEALWERRSREWEAELASTRSELERLERASHEYTVVGSQILELAKNAKTLFLRQSGPEQARLLKTLLSNCNLRDGSLTPTYRKPFDLLVEGNETGNWLGIRDGIRNWLLTAA